MSLEEAKERIRIAEEKWHTKLNLSSLGLTTNDLSKLLKDNIAFFQQIHRVELMGNQISEIPSEIESLTNVSYLRLENNQIRDIPSAFANMRSLISLGLNGNPLTAATIGFIDSIGQVRIRYDMSAHEQVNSEVTALEKLYPEEGKRAQALNQINALGYVERQAVETFLSRIQNSRYWRSDRLFNQYFKETLLDMMAGLGYDSPGSTNQTLQDIVESSAGCATNATGTIFSYYAKSTIAKWQRDNGRDKIEYADLVRVGGALKLDIVHVALQEYANTLISENNIDGDRAEAIADLLRIANGASFDFQDHNHQVRRPSTFLLRIANAAGFGFRDHNHKISNPLTLPDSISGYGLTATDRAKEVFLLSLCKTNNDGSLDASYNNGLTIDDAKLEVIVNNYLAMHDISVSDRMGWFTSLSSILKNPDKEISDNGLKGESEAIREIYQRIYLEYHDVIEGNEFIESLTQVADSGKLLLGVNSEEEYLNKVFSGLSQIVCDFEMDEGKLDVGGSSSLLPTGVGISREQSQANSVPEGAFTGALKEVRKRAREQEIERSSVPGGTFRALEGDRKRARVQEQGIER